MYLNEHNDADETKRMVEDEGCKAITIGGDVGDMGFCREVVNKTMQEFGSIDILVNNAGEQHVCDDIVKMDFKVSQSVSQSQC